MGDQAGIFLFMGLILFVLQIMVVVAILRTARRTEETAVLLRMLVAHSGINPAECGDLNTTLRAWVRARSTPRPQASGLPRP